MMDKFLYAYIRPRMGRPGCQHNPCSLKSLDCWFNYLLVLIWDLKFNVMGKNLDKYGRPGIVQQTPPGISWIDPVGVNITLGSLKSLDC